MTTDEDLPTDSQTEPHTDMDIDMGNDKDNTSTNTIQELPTNTDADTLPKDTETNCDTNTSDLLQLAIDTLTNIDTDNQTHTFLNTPLRSTRTPKQPEPSERQTHNTKKGTFF